MDENKNRANLAKHGVAFEDAAQVCSDPALSLQPAGVVEQEQRWNAIGWRPISQFWLFATSTKKATMKKSSESSQREKRTTMKENRITLNSIPKITKAQRKPLKALANMPDDQIDFSDIPEMKDWSRGFPFRQRPRTVTTKIDNDILEWLKGQDKEFARPLNRILRVVMELTQSVGGRRRSAA